MPPGVARNLSGLARLIGCAANGTEPVDLNGSSAAGGVAGLQGHAEPRSFD